MGKQSCVAAHSTESEIRAYYMAVQFLKYFHLLLTWLDHNMSEPTTIFEDNKGCIDLVNVPKIRPRTKHIALKYHHFRSFVRNKKISIQYIETKSQIADIFTKALNDVQFAALRSRLIGEF